MAWHRKGGFAPGLRSGLYLVAAGPRHSESRIRVHRTAACVHHGNQTESLFIGHGDLVTGPRASGHQVEWIRNMCKQSPSRLNLIDPRHPDSALSSADFPFLRLQMGDFWSHPFLAQQRRQPENWKSLATAD